LNTCFQVPGLPQCRRLEWGLRLQFNLYEPVVFQYLRWSWRVLNGDLGLSLEHGRPVHEVIGERLT